MDDIKFTNNVLARCSSDWHGANVDVSDLIVYLHDFICAGNHLDEVKKALFYGKKFPESLHALDVENVTPAPDFKTQRIIHAILGILTESVELAEALLARVESNREFDEINLKEEAGDLQWYRALLLNMLSTTHEENIALVDRKLEKRFGAVFSAEKANNRDLDGERQTLEG